MRGTKVYTKGLHELIEFVEQYHVAIPEFQRGFVWKTKQVKDLFDSLIQRYPIGSVIIWKTRQDIEARTLDGEPLPREKYLVLDGQQRITSLYYLCHHQKFAQDKVKSKFHQTCDNREKQLIDFEKFTINGSQKKPILEYTKTGDGNFDDRKFDRLIGQGYRFPIIIIDLQKYRQAIEVFERINQAGTKIATESIFLSETWNKHAKFGKILREWKRRNNEYLSSKIDTIIFIHTFALIFQLEDPNKMKGSIEVGVRNLKSIAELIRKDSSDRYNVLFSDSVDAVGRAVDYLRSYFNIHRISDLPSQTMLTVLSIYFYYKKGNHSTLQVKELRKWFWRSSITNRYIGSGYNTNIGPDARRFRDLAVSGHALHLPSISSPSLGKFEGIDLRTGRSTLRNLIKLALWENKPTFINGQQIKPEDVASQYLMPEYDHFYPFDLHRKKIADNSINNILNLHYLSKPDNVRKGKQLPSEWLEQEIEANPAKGKFGTSAKAIKRYFQSELLPFSTFSELKRFERGLFQKRIKSRRVEFEKIYTRFLKRRHKLFLKILIKKQKGN